jgi:hypothetical protein
MYCGQDAVGIRLARVCDSGSTICAKAFITYIRVTVSVSNVLAADVFWTVYFLLTSRAIKQALATYPAPPLSFVSFNLLALQVSRHGNWAVVCFHLVDSKGTEKKHSGLDTVHIHASNVECRSESYTANLRTSS